MNDLHMICVWLAPRRLKLNTSKVKVMVISRKRSPPRPVIQIQGDTVEHVSSFKLLGVVITSDLTWKIHIQHIICKVRKLLGFLHRVFAEGGRRCLVQLYKSIILPHLDYCSPIWDPHQKTHIEKLEMVQSFTARIVPGEWSKEASDLKEELQWSGLLLRRQQQKLCFCHRIVSGASIIPSVFFPRAPRLCA